VAKEAKGGWEQTGAETRAQGKCVRMNKTSLPTEFA